MDYKGFKLHPCAVRESDGKWSAEVVIERTAEDDAEDFVYKENSHYVSESEAEAASITLGQMIVDGKHPVHKLP